MTSARRGVGDHELVVAQIRGFFPVHFVQGQNDRRTARGRGPRELVAAQMRGFFPVHFVQGQNDRRWWDLHKRTWGVRSE
jgi:hypothetical protein